MQNVLADLCVESEAATAAMMRLARAYDARSEDGEAPVRPAGHRRGEVLGVQALAAARGRGARVPGRQRLRRGSRRCRGSTASRRSTASGRAAATSSVSTSCAPWRRAPRSSTRSSPRSTAPAAAIRASTGSSMNLRDDLRDVGSGRSARARPRRAHGAGAPGLAARARRRSRRRRGVLRLAPRRRAPPRLRHAAAGLPLHPHHRTGTASRLKPRISRIRGSV